MNAISSLIENNRRLAEMLYWANAQVACIPSPFDFTKLPEGINLIEVGQEYSRAQLESINAMLDTQQHDQNCTCADCSYDRAMGSVGVSK